jgi:hypothetical protein
MKLRTLFFALAVLVGFCLSVPASLKAQGFGPALPPGFYGTLPAPYPGLEAPEGIFRLALVYTGMIVGETDPCG